MLKEPSIQCGLFCIEESNKLEMEDCEE